MEHRIRQIINEIFSDLQQACADSGEPLCAEALTDCLEDRMCDENKEYRAMPWEKRRAMTLRIAREYV